MDQVAGAFATAIDQAAGPATSPPASRPRSSTSPKP
jgi:hypothetical protein